MATAGTGLKIDLTEFGAWLKREMEFTPKDIAETLNWHGYKICKAANALTKKADKATIAREIGPTATEVIGHKIRITKRRITKAEHEAANGKT